MSSSKSTGNWVQGLPCVLSSCQNKEISPPKVWAPLFAMLCTMWHGQRLVNVDEFCFLTRVITEFLLPMVTAVLSTPTATQFSQDTPVSEIILSILPNKASAVDSLYVPISNNWDITFPFSSSKTHTNSGFIFTSSSSFEPSVCKK